MIKSFVNQWIELIRHIFPSKASIEVHEGDDIFLKIDWKLKNDLERKNKRSRLIRIVISREAIEDCQDFNKAGLRFQNIVGNKFSGFNPDHNHPWFVNPPTEEWIISTFDLN